MLGRPEWRSAALGVLAATACAAGVLVAAHADARAKADRATEEKMKGATAGLPLPPGFKLPF